MFMGKLHSEGGIPKVIPETGQSIEVETDEPLITADALKEKTIKKRHGTNVEILDQINKKVGAKGMREKAEEVHLGDAIVCRKSAYDKTKRTYIGTDKQIVSAINESNGCRNIESGGKAIEPDGSVTQYKKGGGIPDINARWDKKKKQVEELANNIRRLRMNITRDLGSDDEKTFLTSLVISVCMKTSERIGNDVSEGNNHRGVTGFKKKHVKINGTEITFRYTGKSGTEHNKVYTDKVLAKHLQRAIENSSCAFVFCTSDGFRIKADRVNRYLDEYNISAKSIRGYNANKMIVEKLEKVEIPDTENKRKKFFNKVAKSVAEKIGHGTATLKKHYMMPELPDNYIFDSKIITIERASIYATGGELGAESLKKRVINKLSNDNTITIKDLMEIVGREPNYPNEYVGGLKLQKCFLIPYYRLA